MMEQPFKADIHQKTASEWTAINPFLHKNDLGIESDTGKIKVGVGALWSNTTYLPGASSGWSGRFIATAFDPDIASNALYPQAEFTVVNGVITAVDLGEPVVV
jgi:hypothetical protein